MTTTQDPVPARARAHIRYTLADGTPVPGVTTVLGVLNKPALVPWANRLGLEGIKVSEYVDHLASIGTLAHYLILCHLTQAKPELAEWTAEQVDRAENALISFFEWQKGHDLKPILCEAALVSEAHRYGGTIDCYGLLDGVPALIDFKTSGRIYPEHLYQVAAYADLLVEHHHPVDQVRILQIGRDPTESFSERVLPTYDKHLALFHHALAIYQLKKVLE